MIDRRVVGRIHQWTLEPKNALLGPLRALFRAEEALESELKRELTEGLRSPRVRRALLFGSVARGTEKGWSDVDILIELRRASDRQGVEDLLFPVRQKIRDRYGLVLAPLIVTRDDLHGRISPSFLESVEREGVDLLRSS
ncbi:MAG: nucleotidyltransferase domain-containing protein [Euryarchaeota archaeon]|nr:nucleotidyltransferase domain-containing protein [Euryarchaeota archaeon]MDE1837818.1 nucleotidyltransferase domain-containing protein [Euryarchaeota archaeon]MDE1880092.1 nucleotidyltransferase domain-containing protein [Euryarchaeota archaeon]